MSSSVFTSEVLLNAPTTREKAHLRAMSTDVHIKRFVSVIARRAVSRSHISGNTRAYVALKTCNRSCNDLHLHHMIRVTGSKEPNAMCNR